MVNLGTTKVPCPVGDCDALISCPIVSEEPTPTVQRGSVIGVKADPWPLIVHLAGVHEKHPRNP